MRLGSWCDNGVGSANRLDVRLRKLPHDSRNLVVHVSQTALLSRAVIINRVLRGPALRI